MDTTYIYLYEWMGVQQFLVEKQNICYLDTISGLGCLLPRNKYTALAPYFVRVRGIFTHPQSVV
jgi:hypothetical protein